MLLGLLHVGAYSCTPFISRAVYQSCIIVFIFLSMCFLVVSRCLLLQTKIVQIAQRRVSLQYVLNNARRFSKNSCTNLLSPQMYVSIPCSITSLICVLSDFYSHQRVFHCGFTLHCPELIRLRIFSFLDWLSLLPPLGIAFYPFCCCCFCY